MLLDPHRTVEHVDAVVMTGGSAFGLASADGVVAGLASDDRGHETAARPVPIVVGMAVYDLGVGDAMAHPTAVDGHRAYTTADTSFATGAVGAGTGATIGNWRGAEHATPGGFGAATVRAGDLEVTALLTVNALGDINDGSLIASIADGSVTWPTDEVNPFSEPPRTNTTIGVIITNATLTKLDCYLVAQGGHDGMARALVPAHTRADGDALVAAATGQVTASPPRVRLLAAVAVEQAIRNAIPSSGNGAL